MIDRRHRRVHSLRIAISVMCGMACLLLVIMWVRSYSSLDRLDAPVGRFWPGSTVAVVSVRGLLMLGVQQKLNAVESDPRLAWRLQSAPVGQTRLERIEYGTLGFKWIHDQRERGVQMPYWFAVTVSAVCIATQWIPWSHRYSLRTLLIGMTLIALALGIAVLSK